MKKKDTALPSEAKQAGSPRAGTSNRARSRKDALREFATQAAENAPDIESRVATARKALGNHPLNDASRGAQALLPSPGPAPGPASPPASGLNRDSAQETSSNKELGTALEQGEPRNVKQRVGQPRGSFQTVPMSLIDPNPFNARKTYRESRIFEMAASLASHGQETPGTATIRNGRYVLAAGHYRYKALGVLNAPEMALMVIPDLTDRELYEISFRENAEREDQTTFDNALAWCQLLEDKIYATEQELATAVGQSAPNVNKAIGILRLSREVLELVEQDPAKFKLSVLYELVLFEKAGGTERTLVLAKAAADGEIGRAQIQDARAKIQAAKPRKDRETSRQYDLQVAGAGSGVLKEWPSGKVTFELSIEDDILRAQIVAELRAKFDTKS
jgi:ParB family chromosome partitioning protein